MCAGVTASWWPSENRGVTWPLSSHGGRAASPPAAVGSPVMGHSTGQTWAPPPPRSPATCLGIGAGTGGTSQMQILGFYPELLDQNTGGGEVKPPTFLINCIVDSCAFKFENQPLLHQREE